MNEPYLTAKQDGVLIRLHVQPGAKRSEVVGRYGDALKVRIQAPPVDGKANLAVIEFLAKALKVPKKNVGLVSGETSRSKSFFVSGVSIAAVTEKLGPC